MKKATLYISMILSAAALQGCGSDDSSNTSGSYVGPGTSSSHVGDYQGCINQGGFLYSGSNICELRKTQTLGTATWVNNIPVLFPGSINQGAALPTFLNVFPGDKISFSGSAKLGDWDFLSCDYFSGSTEVWVADSSGSYLLQTSVETPVNGSGVLYIGFNSQLVISQDAECAKLSSFSLTQRHCVASNGQIVSCP